MANPTDRPGPPPETDQNAELAHTLKTLGTDPHAPIVDPRLLPSIPGYTIVQKLGAGSFGQVYEAVREDLNKSVALKILDPRIAPDEIAMEAKALAHIEHENVVRLYDWDFKHDPPYIAMSFVEGGTLRTYMNRKGLLEAVEAVLLLEKMAGALHVVHTEAEILHRDLKPENVLLTRSGEPRLADFGLAESTQVAEGPGGMVGTLFYMPVEQIRGKPLKPTADIYALGVIFYEMLSGSRPFHGASVERLIEAIEEGRPRSLRERNPSVSRDLEAVCLKCLAADPEDRYPNARELLDDLGRWKRGEPTRARPIAAWARVVRWMQRKPLVTAALFLTALLTVASALLWWNVAVRGRLERQQAMLEQKRNALESLEQVYRSHLIDHAKEEISRTLPGSRTRSLEAVLRLYETLITRLEKEEVLRPLLAEVRMDYGSLCERIGDWERARAAFTAALEVYATLVDKRVRAARAHLELGKVLTDSSHDLGSREEVEAHYQRALELIEGAEEDAGARLLRADILHECGIFYGNEDKLSLERRREKSLACYRKAEEIRRALLERDADNRLYKRKLAVSHGYLGDLHLERGQLDKAEEAYRLSEKYRDELVRTGERSPEVSESELAEDMFQQARGKENLARLAARKGHPEEAEPYYREAVRIQRELLVNRKRGAVVKYQFDLYRCAKRLAEMYLSTPEGVDQAEPYLEDMSQVCRWLAQSRGEEADPRLLRYQAGLRVLQGAYHLLKTEPDPAQGQTKLAEAEELFRKLAELDSNSTSASDEHYLAMLHALRGEIDEALGHLKAARQQGYEDLAQLKRQTSTVLKPLAERAPEELSALLSER